MIKILLVSNKTSTTSSVYTFLNIYALLSNNSITSNQLRSHSIVSQNFMESEVLLQHSQELPTYPYPEADQLGPHHPHPISAR
jgi:hypothetical protein